MKGLAALLGVRQAILSPESDLWRHVAVRPLADHETPLAEHQVPHADGRDFSLVPVHASRSEGARRGVSCPMSPRTCPFGGACHTCPVGVQAKLAISQPGDVYEQEADRVADTIMRIPAPEEEDEKPCSLPGCADTVHRQAAETSTPQSAPPTVHEVLRSPGQPLDPGTRTFMESRFGHDFHRVRLHAGPEASSAAQSIQARAFTVGNDVVLGEGQFAPHAAGGKQLLAHELTHVIQQRGAPPRDQVWLQPHDSCDEPVTKSAAEFISATESLAIEPTFTPVTVQRACYSQRELQPVRGCVAASGDITDVGTSSEELFLFVVNCDDFGAGYEDRLRAFSQRFGFADTVTIHGFASEDGPAEFNENLSCLRALEAKSILLEEGIPESSIRGVYKHGEIPGDRAYHRSAVVHRTAPSVPESEIEEPGAPPSAPEPMTPDTEAPLPDISRLRQLECVIRMGACAAGPRSVPGGVPGQEEIRQYNENCRQQTDYVGPDVTPTGDECAQPPTGAFVDALEFAMSLERRYPGWRDALPNCPCTDAEARNSPDWSGPDACLPDYHPGACSGYRSSRAFSSGGSTRHGQQCCYDRDGMLITQGPAAGTPDLWAPIGTGIVRHYFEDVRPFDRLGWETYNRYWIPNNGNNCPTNRGGGRCEEGENE